MVGERRIRLQPRAQPASQSQFIRPQRRIGFGDSAQASLNRSGGVSSLPSSGFGRPAVGRNTFNLRSASPGTRQEGFVPQSLESGSLGPFVTIAALAVRAVGEAITAGDEPEAAREEIRTLTAQAEAIDEASQVEFRRAGIAANRLESAQRAQVGAAGVSVSGSTAGDVIQEDLTEASLERELRLRNAKQTAAVLRRTARKRERRSKRHTDIQAFAKPHVYFSILASGKREVGPDSGRRSNFIQRSVSRGSLRSVGIDSLSKIFSSR